MPTSSIPSTSSTPARVSYEYHWGRIGMAGAGLLILLTLAWQWVPAKQGEDAASQPLSKPTGTQVNRQPVSTNADHTGIVIHTSSGVTQLSIAAAPATTQTTTAEGAAPAVSAPDDAEPQVDQTLNIADVDSVPVALPAESPPPAETSVVSAPETAQHEPATAPDPATVEVLSNDIKRARLTLSIRNREPGDPAPAIIELPQDDLARVFFFTEIEGQAGKTVIHRWYRNGRQQARVTIPIGSDSWRSYSSKFLNEDMAGQWEVKVFDRQGKVLARSAFTFSAASL